VEATREADWLQVMVATTGSVLLPKEAVGELRNSLLPLTTILTPNIPEAQLLLGDTWRGSIKHFEDIAGMAQCLRKLGPRYVLVKGGHAPFRQDGQRAVTEEEKKRVINVLAGPNEEVVYIESPYLDSKNTHGTGCSLACRSYKIA
jgi:hydroxymethylpyrimidine kinase/phosphomethylpyrimidine kinase